MKKATKEGARTAGKLLFIIINIVILIVLLDVYRGKGFIYFMIYIMLFSIWRCWQHREQIMTTIRHMEGMIWGKPLDREFWKPGEFQKKRRKIKFVWKKKTDSKQTEL